MAEMCGAKPRKQTIMMNGHAQSAGDSDAANALSSLHEEHIAHASAPAPVSGTARRGTGELSPTVAAEASSAVALAAFSESATPKETTKDEMIPPAKGRAKERFPNKLYEILSKEEFDYAIKWLPHGRSFVFVSPEKFTKMVLPLYFKPCKFSSFTRKLYRWGFRQISKGSDAESFFHANFRRDEKALLDKMNCGPQLDERPSNVQRYPRARQEVSQQAQQSFPAMFNLQGYQPYAQSGAGLALSGNPILDSQMLNQMQQGTLPFSYQSLMNAAASAPMSSPAPAPLSSTNGGYGGAGTLQQNMQQKLADTNLFTDTTVQQQFQAGLFEPLTTNRLGNASASMGVQGSRGAGHDDATGQLSDEIRQRRGGAA